MAKKPPAAILHQGCLRTGAHRLRPWPSVWRSGDRLGSQRQLVLEALGRACVALEVPVVSIAAVEDRAQGAAPGTSLAPAKEERYLVVHEFFPIAPWGEVGPFPSVGLYVGGHSDWIAAQSGFSGSVREERGRWLESPVVWRVAGGLRETKLGEFHVWYTGAGAQPIIDGMKRVQ